MLLEEYVNIVALEMASPGEPALCQLYRHTFVTSVYDCVAALHGWYWVLLNF